MIDKQEMDRFSMDYIDDNLEKIDSDKEKLIFLTNLRSDFEKFRIKRKAFENDLKEAFDIMEANKLRDYMMIEIQRLEKIILINTTALSKPIQRESSPGNENNLGNSIIGFNLDYVATIYKNLELFFSENDKSKLKLLLEGKEITGKIIFSKSGNQLADIFKQLYHLSFVILNCDKKDLENWLLKNFDYSDRTVKGRIASFSKAYLDKQISGKVNPCKNPLFKIFIDSSHNLCFEALESKQRKTMY